MATNQIFRPGHRFAIVATDPAVPASGGPVRVGKMTGVAMLDEGAGGAAATETVIDFGPAIYDLSVDDNEGGGIAVADEIWYHDATTGAPATHLNNSPTTADGFFGYALETVAINGTTTIRVKHAENGKPGTVTAADIAANSVGVSELTTNLKLGTIALPLAQARLIAANDIAAKNAADGGLVSLDTDPTFKRINAATDKNVRMAWAATSVVPVQWSVSYPSDLDDASAVTVRLLVGKDANMDAAATLGVAYFEGIGDANAGGNTAAITEIAGLNAKSVVIAAGNIGAYPNTATVEIIPSAHGNDALYLYAAWLEYVRKD